MFGAANTPAATLPARIRRRDNELPAIRSAPRSGHESVSWQEWVKMLQRPMAVADGECVGGSNGGADVAFGDVDRGFEGKFLSEAGRDRRRQRAASTVRILCRDTRRRKGFYR